MKLFDEVDEAVSIEARWGEVEDAYIQQLLDHPPITSLMPQNNPVERNRKQLAKRLAAKDVDRVREAFRALGYIPVKGEDNGNDNYAADCGRVAEKVRLSQAATD